MNFVSLLNKNTDMKRPQQGIVVDNNDPEKLGRVKMTVPGIIEGDLENIPWTYPNNQHAFGGTPSSAHVTIPQIGSNLNVEFKHGDIYAPIYTGHNISQNNMDMSKFKDGYPKAYGWQDPSGNSFVQDRKAGTYTYGHVAADDNQQPNDTNDPTAQGTPASEDKKVAIGMDKQGNSSKSQKGNFNHQLDGAKAVQAGGTISHQASSIFLNC
jgi:uncharacterized protein involved in type VI secretion and phage assembly